MAERNGFDFVLPWRLSSAHQDFPCVSTLTALQFFLNMGLPPGSLTSALLRQDREDAVARAHMNLRTQVNLREGAIIDRMLRVVAETVPVELFKTEADIERWSEHEGLKGADQTIWMLFKLRCPNFN